MQLPALLPIFSLFCSQEIGVCFGKNKQIFACTPHYGVSLKCIFCGHFQGINSSLVNQSKFSCSEKLKRTGLCLYPLTLRALLKATELGHFLLVLHWKIAAQIAVASSATCLPLFCSQEIGVCFG